MESGKILVLLLSSIWLNCQVAQTACITTQPYGKKCLNFFKLQKLSVYWFTDLMKKGFKEKCIILNYKMFVYL